MAENKIMPPSKLIVIGGSAGSLEVVMDIISTLDKTLYVAMAVVLHRKSSIDSSLAFLLADKTSWPVKEVEDKDKIEPQHVFLAPGDYHLLFEKDASFSLDVSEKINYSRPSIDASFESAADAYGDRVIAILLSGANADGMEGMKKIKESGGICIVQDPQTAEVSYMPKEAIANVEVDHIIEGHRIGSFLNTLFV